jgi:hypothetical protein
MQTDLRYAISDVWSTFPLIGATQTLGDLGWSLEEARLSAGRSFGIGPTALHSLVDEPACDLEEVTRIRSLMRDIDAELFRAYGWSDLAPDLTWETYRNVRRFGLSADIRQEVLDRLLELNHERARAEGQGVPARGGLF